MREVTYSEKTFQVRAMKRKEVMALRKEGFNLNVLNPATADDAMDKVFDVVLTPEEVALIGDLYQREAMDLFKDILKETFGSGEEEKN